MASKNMNLCEGPFTKKIILYTIPIILTGLLQLTFNAADLIIVGQFCGSSAVGAVGATGSLTTLFVNFFMGLSVGAGVTVAHSLGAKDYRQTEQTIHTAIPVALICGILLTVIGLTLSEPMLILMDTPENELPLAALYMKIYFCGSAPSLIYNFGAAILRAAGDTKSPLIFLTASGILNVVLNTIFVTLFDMSVAGVSLATVLSQCLSCVLVLAVLRNRQDACKLRFSKLRLRWIPLKKILSIGLPSGIQSSLFSIANVQIQSAINSFGSVFLSGNAAASNLGNFAMTATNTFHQTAVNFIGQNMGARKIENIRIVFRKCIFAALAVGIVLGGIVTLFAEPLLRIYITDSEEAIAYGIIRIICVYLPVPIAGIMEITTGALRGIGNSLAPMLTSILGVCVLRIVWLHTLFVWFPTPQCLYLSFPVSWGITFVAQFIIYRISLRKKEKTILSHP